MTWSELYLGPGTWILAVLAGGIVGMDAVSWPQVMVSRPLVSATIGGALLGNPAAGMLTGALLEVLTLRHPPFGAAKYPDTGPAGLVAGASYAAAGGHAEAPSSRRSSRSDRSGSRPRCRSARRGPSRRGSGPPRPPPGAARSRGRGRASAGRGSRTPPRRPS